MKTKTKLPYWLEGNKSVVFYAENKPPKVKCSQDEKEIYGVDFKVDPNQQPSYAIIYKKSFHNSQKAFFEVRVVNRRKCEISFYEASYYFAEKTEAIEFAKEELKRPEKEGK